jgi:hypothetical protein
MGEAHIFDDEMTRESAGALLRRGREAAGLDLSEIGEITKIPERHLQTIEQGEFTALPARAYAVGFARTYARAVGLDEGEIAQRVRDELDGASAEQMRARPSSFEAGDPARVPSSRLSWIAAGFALAVILAGFLFWRSFYSPAAELPPIVAEDPPAPSAPPVAGTAGATTGQVVFTATSPDVWIRLYDASGTLLLEKTLAQGERVEVPAGAQRPLLWTGRPEALAITVGNREVPRLAESQQTMKDVPVDAQALLARAGAGARSAAPAARPSVAAAAPAPRSAPPARASAVAEPAPSPRAVAPAPAPVTAAESRAPTADNP